MEIQCDQCKEEVKGQVHTLPNFAPYMKFCSAECAEAWADEQIEWECYHE